MRYLLDENLSTAIAVAARRRGLDVVSSHECNRDGLTDREQLLAAAREGRCLVTEDCKDLGPISREFAAQGLPHAGVLCISPGGRVRDVGAVVRALQQYAGRYPVGVPAYLVDYV